MAHQDDNMIKPATKAAITLFAAAALVGACFAPAIAQYKSPRQKDQSHHDTDNSHRPIIVGYLA